MNIKNKPIGVFDSGLGGLTVVKSLIENLPNENIIYFGDTGRVPYGNRSKQTIIEYTAQDIEFLMNFDIKAIVIACNTADSMAKLEMLKRFNLPIIGVVAPAGRKAAAVTKNNKIGIIGTNATISSKAYETVIGKYNSEAEVTSVACPLLTPLVEEGRIHKGDIVIETVLREYLAPIIAAGADTLILGCTHYPLLYDIVKEIMPDVNIICSGSASTELLKNVLGEHGILNDSSDKGEIRYYVSDAPEKFAESGSFFIGRPIHGKVSKVSIE